MSYCEMPKSATEIPVERENLSALMQMTNARLSDAVLMAEDILSNIRGPIPHGNEESVRIDSAMDAARLNRDMAERLCGALRELALLIGVCSN